MKNRFSKNAKLNKALETIYNDLINCGIEEVKHYFNEFKNEPDYNIAQYGNLLIYYNDIYNFYRECGYKSTDKFSTDKIWETYKRQVGYITRYIIKENAGV